ncbi:hydroxymethylglutaryl-CoA lyase [bacterium]|nr:hydroxymethylglutaryl-CoA lyase [bacterium]
MANYPKKVLLREDGPREGFQMHAKVIPTAEKLRLIDLLAETGISSIEVTSFVRADKVPQLADAEEIAQGIIPRAGVRYRALYLNQKGLERASTFPNLQPEGYVLLAASEEFLKRNNNQTLDQALAELPAWIKLFQEKSMRFERLMISTAFGDAFAGKLKADLPLSVVAKALEVIAANNSSVEEVTFADTTGYANPESVQQLVGNFRDRYPQLSVGLHLHDTRGTGMANVYAGLELGVDRFDCSVAGLGGCPFAPGAAGNVPTEDVAFLCAELGIETGIDLQRYIQCALEAEKIIGHKLPGKLKQGGKI